MTMIHRRKALGLAGAGFALLAAPAVVRAQTSTVRSNVSGFRMQNWQDHFDSLGVGIIVADLDSRALHYWSGTGEDYLLYPSSIPMTEELTKRGYTEVTRKRVGPDWTPTVNMRRRDPSLPAYMPPGPSNPLGTHAIYTTWPAYLIHGTHDTRKIGRPSSSGCVGLYNEHIAELFEAAKIGTKVLFL